MSVVQILQHIAMQIRHVSGEQAALEARLLAQHGWGMQHEEMLRDWDKPVSAHAAQQLQQLAARRAQREPMSQILGSKAFWKDTFLVTRDVLTPRADSETMMEALIRLRPQRDVPVRILDLGTGSGALLLSALREYSQATGVAVDLSAAALTVAQENAKRLNLLDRVAFRHGEWCKPLDKSERFDMILTNPPYIARADIAALDEDVKGYEPHLALDGGPDGLDCYRSIFTNVGQHMHSGALLLVEVGQGQADDVAQLGTDAGLHPIEICNDLAGTARIVCFTHSL